MKLFVSLLVVVGLIYGTVFILRIMMVKGKGRFFKKNAGLLKVLASVGLSPGNTIHLVKAGDKVFMLGSANSGVTLLADIGDMKAMEFSEVFESEVLEDQETRQKPGMGKRGPLFFLGLVVIGLAVALTGWVGGAAAQQTIPVPSINFGLGQARTPGDVALSLQILFLLTALTLAPALLIMVTSFTRLVIVLSFIRSAIGTQQIPPTQVLIGLALFLTVFTMMPVWNRINDSALQPYLAGKISQKAGLERAWVPLREFMFKQTRERDIALFVRFAKIDRPRNPADIPGYVLIPAFIISELKTAFQMGFIIYIPFLVIDMVVASTLMSMGMMMLPPVMIALPFKVLLFVMVDGWNLIVNSLVASFH